MADPNKFHASLPSHIVELLKQKPDQPISVRKPQEIAEQIDLDDILWRAKADLGIDYENYLNFAVYGSRTDGRSSFANNFLELGGAARIDRSEGTDGILRYRSKHFPSLILWEFPEAGIRSRNSGFMDHKLFTFDCIILISSRFVETNVEVAHLAKKWNIPCAILRPKRDSSAINIATEKKLNIMDEDLLMEYIYASIKPRFFLDDNTNTYPDAAAEVAHLRKQIDQFCREKKIAEDELDFARKKIEQLQKVAANRGSFLSRGFLSKGMSKNQFDAAGDLVLNGSVMDRMVDGFVKVFARPKFNLKQIDELVKMFEAHLSMVENLLQQEEQQQPDLDLESGVRIAEAAAARDSIQQVKDEIAPWRALARHKKKIEHEIGLAEDRLLYLCDHVCMLLGYLSEHVYVSWTLK